MSTSSTSRPRADGNGERRPTPGRDRWLRWERTPGGRVLISVFVLVTLLAVLSVNMPASETKDRLTTWTEPYVRVLGLDQGWAVFASPDPRRITAYLEGRIQHRDGSIAVRPIPIQHGLAEYWDYRWHRVGEALLFDPEFSYAWEPYSRWLAGQDRAAGGDPVRVTLVSRSAKTRPPGPGPEREPWIETSFYTLQVGAP